MLDKYICLLLLFMSGFAMRRPSKLKASILFCRKEINAPVVFVEYASLTCPVCAAFHSNVYPQLNKEYIETGKVKFIHREIYFVKAGLWAL